MSHYGSEDAGAEFETEVLLAYLPSLLGSKGYVEDVNVSVDRVVQLTRRRSDPQRAFKALFLRWLSLLARGTVDVAHHFSENLRDLVAQCDSEVAEMMHQRMLGTTHMFRGEFDAASEALEYFEENYNESSHGLAMSEFGVTDNYSTVQCCRICIAALRGDASLSRDLQEMTAANAAMLGLPHNRCHVLAYGGACAAALVGDWSTMMAYSQQLEKLAREHGLPFWLATASMYRGIGYVLEGAPRRGQEAFDAGVGWFREQGSSFLQPTFRVMYESASAEAGLLGSTAALHALDGQLDDGERWVRPEILRLRGLDAIRCDDTATGRELLTTALELAQTQKTLANAERIEADVLAAVDPVCEAN